MNLSWVLFGLGTLMGLAYAGLGIAAAMHIKDEGMSGSDRFFTIATLWSIASGRYDDQGRKLCVWGNIALVLAIAAWVAWAKLR